MNLPICTSLSFAWLDKKNWTFGSVYEQMEEGSGKVVVGLVINGKASVVKLSQDETQPTVKTMERDTQ